MFPVLRQWRHWLQRSLVRSSFRRGDVYNGKDRDQIPYASVIGIYGCRGHSSVFQDLRRPGRHVCCNFSPMFYYRLCPFPRMVAWKPLSLRHISIIVEFGVLDPQLLALFAYGVFAINRHQNVNSRVRNIKCIQWTCNISKNKIYFCGALDLTKFCWPKLSQCNTFLKFCCLLLQIFNCY